jgi:putative membrane protein
MKKLSVILALIAMLFFIDACSTTRSTTGSGTGSTTGTGTGGTTDNTGATGSSRTGSTASSVNQEFVTDAASGGMMEVELGTMAVQNASSQEVKDFGRRMIDDHSKANDELKSIAAKENIPVPAALKDENRDDVDKLSKLSGSDFDKEYIDMMVKDHQKDIKNFEDMAQNAQSPELKQFAQKTLPTLRQHLKMAQDIQDRLGNK